MPSGTKGDKFEFYRTALLICLVLFIVMIAVSMASCFNNWGSSAQGIVLSITAILLAAVIGLGVYILYKDWKNIKKRGPPLGVYFVGLGILFAIFAALLLYSALNNLSPIYPAIFGCILVLIAIGFGLLYYYFVKKRSVQWDDLWTTEYWNLGDDE